LSVGCTEYPHVTACVYDSYKREEYFQSPKLFTMFELFDYCHETAVKVREQFLYLDDLSFVVRCSKDQTVVASFSLNDVVFWEKDPCRTVPPAVTKFKNNAVVQHLIATCGSPEQYQRDIKEMDFAEKDREAFCKFVGFKWDDYVDLYSKYVEAHAKLLDSFVDSVVKLAKK